MELKLKPISREGIPEAIAKVELYRNLNEPGEAESICRDILAVEPDNQTALRLLMTMRYFGGTAACASCRAVWVLSGEKRCKSLTRVRARRFKNEVI